MANVFNPKARTWKIDTAASTTVDANDLLVDSIVWSGATAAGTVSIQDPASVVLWQATAGAEPVIDLTDRRWPTGFKVPTLSSGQLLITLK